MSHLSSEVKRPALDIGSWLGWFLVESCRCIGSWRGSELPIQVIIGSRLAALTLNVAGLVLSARKGLFLSGGTPPDR